MNNDILIIENEYYSVKITFETANALCFEDRLRFKNISKSQDIRALNLDDYSVIFIDISLAANSTLDGFGIIEYIRIQYPNLLNRIVIITGNNKIQDAIKAHQLESYNLTVLIKPVGFQEIENVLRDKGVV
jgi:DNA-binding NtrC family response regulator